ncbi:low molecular weight phosphotyrosine protein phosphatase [Photobacterium sanctipauli]|uniref:protein-tyrosine-phosphatase n=1 Tax=Photobacterium sanctipauli TaxID=1342794 RepID=A0A2T3NN89_9GAMM|nr:low molecular weight protein-tyrosine-phosphatase [Photobacterium sanctipauli]PSW16949.1 low molecular weight phosphotyrosine protein phosphatase [Photobacterium sanctipauli]
MAYKILVVCMGNICRSPTGEAILRAKSQERGGYVTVDSAGTIGYHQGEQPDPRSMAAGEARGYSFDGIRSRKITADDFEHFDLILAADHANLADMQAICPDEYQHKLKLFLSYGNNPDFEEIPDPYYGGSNGFELVLDLIEEASDAVLDSIQQ